MAGTLQGAALLEAWETGSARGAIDRPLAMLWAAGTGGADPASLPLGERDRRLLALHAATFGDRMECLSACPFCGASVEIATSAGALADTLPDETAETMTAGGDAVVTLRPLDSRDLAAAAACKMSEEARALLIERALCGVAVADVAQQSALIERIEARAEAAELALAMRCPDCGGNWSEVLDVGSFLWAEAEAAALRLMAEIGEIARAFHWSEGEILGMGPQRRAAYLMLARSA
jgi:hypothetical protein